MIDLIQKISNMRWKYGGQKDEGVCIPKVESGFWIPKVSSPRREPLTHCLAPLRHMLLLDHSCQALEDPGSSGSCSPRTHA